MTKIVVALELKHVGPGPDSFLVLGLLAFFETHIQRFSSVEECAKALWQSPLEPVQIPHEEGWESVGDLPKALWHDLVVRIYVLKRAKIDEEKWNATDLRAADLA